MAHSNHICLFFIVVVNALYSNCWHITYQLNPGCSPTYLSCSSSNLVYIRTENDSMSAHFLLSASDRLGPSLLVVVSSDPKSAVQVDWAKLDGDERPVEAITVKDAIQSYALVINSLIEYNDTEDTVSLSADPQGPYSYRFHPLDQMTWSLLNEIPDFDEHQIERKDLFPVLYHANRSRLADVQSIFGEKSHLQLKFMISSVKQHNPTVPRLQFIPGLSIQFELALANLKSNFTRARFGLEMLLISNDVLEDYRVTSTFSFNDELSPGIFELININLNHHKPAAVSCPIGYVQTRPVCYTADGHRELKNSRNANMGKVGGELDADVWNSTLYHSLPYLYYGNRIAPHSTDRVGLRVQNISFGTPEDGFYKASNFIIWTATFGLDEPPVEPLSSLLIGLLSLSAIVILGSMLFGTLLILICRRRFQTAASERLRESNSSPPPPPLVDFAAVNT